MSSNIRDQQNSRLWACSPFIFVCTDNIKMAELLSQWALHFIIQSFGNHQYIQWIIFSPVVFCSIYNITLEIKWWTPYSNIHTFWPRLSLPYKLSRQIKSMRIVLQQTNYCLLCGYGFHFWVIMLSLTLVLIHRFIFISWK